VEAIIKKLQPTNPLPSIETQATTCNRKIQEQANTVF